jgi:hypothetical protein
MGVRLFIQTFKVMDPTCKNCLNAYNSPHDPHVLCWNKEWQGQFMAVDTTVRPNGTCGTWQQRDKRQPKLVFPKLAQLELELC